MSAYLGDGRFATLLIGQSLTSAKRIAESLAKDFSSRESLHESIPRPAITSAVVPWSADNDGCRCLNDALETLGLAEHSGGGKVLEHGEFHRELSDWNEEVSTGNPFANVVAQDIMELFPAFLDRETEQPELVAALRGANLAVQPYIDREGRLAGAVTDEQNTADTFNGNSSETFDSSLPMPETISYQATFPDIYEAFSASGCKTLVVTAGDRPLGYVTRDGFLSMIEPIAAESYDTGGAATDKLSYLVVPHLAGSVED
jgi:hypothetical protein